MESVFNRILQDVFLRIFSTHLLTWGQSSQQFHSQPRFAIMQFLFRCWDTVTAPRKGCRLPQYGWQCLLWQGAGRECFSLSPAASASHRAAQVENQAESQESLSYIPDAAINFLYGLGQLVSPASLGFSLDKVGRTVNIVDLWSLKL